MLQWYCPLYLLLLYFATTAVLQSDCSCCLVSRQPSPLSELLHDVGKKTEPWYWDDPIAEAWSVKSTCLDLTLRANWYRTVLLFPFGFFPNMSNFYFRFLKYRLCSYPLVSFRKCSPPLPKEIRNNWKCGSLLKMLEHRQQYVTSGNLEQLTQRNKQWSWNSQTGFCSNALTEQATQLMTERTRLQW